ncbi:RNA polymerase sigma factor [Prolixibacter sp. NT017]|uniref:RNA polymerase sigma factor n=1 Tax=Prolixibacter sp. NT017 TaxID=2652390 RepID=UPI00127FA87A|nr:sigma-70 family RNA polymerase sigma factor [Prolixibacter sp. NT017]GET23848.1 RNA polymerase sigma factor [Prolixibacter sp. NT017]
MVTNKDEYYIREILNGDPGSFSHLVEKYKDLAFHVSLKILLNREEAEEAAQDAFIKAYRALPSFKGGAAFKTWFYRIVYNNAISRLRSSQNKRDVSLEDVRITDREVEETETALSRLSSEERQQYLQAALNKMAPEDRGLLVMFYFDELSVIEITEVTNFTESNVKVKLHRGRKKLFELLKGILKDEIISIL